MSSNQGAGVTCGYSQATGVPPEEDEQSQTVINGYEIFEVLGKGSFGQVFKAKKGNEIFALKLLDLNMITEQKIEKFVANEINLMRQLNHKNVVKIYDVFQTTSVIFLVLEYCNQGTLLSYVSKNKPNPKQCLDLFIQILAGIKHIHKFNILHRDLKPENIFIHNGVLKIADFGLAQFESDDFVYCGTSFYMAPEVLQHEAVSQKSDLWSLGITMFYMLFRRLPFYSSSNLLATVQRLSSPALEVKKILLAKDQQIDSEFEEFFRKVLVFDHDQRASFEDLNALPLISNKIAMIDYQEQNMVYSSVGSNLIAEMNKNYLKQQAEYKKLTQMQATSAKIQVTELDRLNAILPPVIQSSFLITSNTSMSTPLQEGPIPVSQINQVQLVGKRPLFQGGTSQSLSMLEDIPEDDSPNISNIYPSNNITHFLDRKRDEITNARPSAKPLKIQVKEISLRSSVRIRTISSGGGGDMQIRDYLTPRRTSIHDLDSPVKQQDHSIGFSSARTITNQQIQRQQSTFTNPDIQFLSTLIRSSIFVLDFESKEYYAEMSAVKQQIYKYQLLEECLNNLQDLRLQYSVKSLVSFIISKMIVFITYHVVAVLECSDPAKMTSRMAGFRNTKKAKSMLAFVLNDLKMWETKMLVFMNGIDVEGDFQNDPDLVYEITTNLHSRGYLKDVILPFTCVIDLLFVGAYSLAEKEREIRYKKFCMYLMLVVNVQLLFNESSSVERMLLSGFIASTNAKVTPRNIIAYIESMTSHEEIDELLSVFVKQCVFPIENIKQIEPFVSQTKSQLSQFQLQNEKQKQDYQKQQQQQQQQSFSVNHSMSPSQQYQFQQQQFSQQYLYPNRR